MEIYLNQQHSREIWQIIKTEKRDDLPFKSLEISLTDLKENNSRLFEKITNHMNVWIERPKWIQALNAVQKQMMERTDSDLDLASVKTNFPVAFVNLPPSERDISTLSMKMHKFVQVEGRIMRSGENKKQEVYREFHCSKCKKEKLIAAMRECRFYFETPERCVVTPGCKGIMRNKQDGSQDENLNYFIDHQIISLHLDKKAFLLTVELDEELAESCFVGDEVVICGTIEIRSNYENSDDLGYVLRAVSVIVQGTQLKLTKDKDELSYDVLENWESEMNKFDRDELLVRDEMVKSVGADINGLSIIKLGLLVTLCSGGKHNSERANSQDFQIREICHLLMIGDPGLGKSQLLKSIASIAPNSQRCVGYFATTAGLTAHCYREAGDTRIEAGALVKANHGVCCIDEINYLSKEHRGSIHEVMESQKISIAKAGIHTEIHTKVSIIAGMNQKNATLPVEAANLNIERSLLSRFDLIFELYNPHDENVTLGIVWHILDGVKSAERVTRWSLERLRMHILIAKDIRVKIAEPAFNVIRNYYIFCRDHCPDIDVGRKTMRLWDSLQRLTLCHAKLMLRTEAVIIDAVTAVMLMESSWTFGHLMGGIDVMHETFPIGPSKEYVDLLLHRLDLQGLSDEPTNGHKFNDETSNSDELQEERNRDSESPSKQGASQISESQFAMTIDDLNNFFVGESDEAKINKDTREAEAPKSPHQIPTTQTSTKESGGMLDRFKKFKFAGGSSQTLPQPQKENIPKNDAEFFENLNNFDVWED